MRMLRFCACISIFVLLPFITKAGIDDVYLTSNQISLIKELNKSLTDTLEVEAQIELVNNLVQKKEFKELQTISNRDLLKLAYFYQDWEITYVEKIKEVKKIESLIAEKAKYHLQKSRVEINQLRIDNDIEDYNLLKRNLEFVVFKMLNRLVIDGKWSSDKLYEYDFNSFEKEGPSMLNLDFSAANETMETWVKFVVNNTHLEISGL